MENFKNTACKSHANPCRHLAAACGLYCGSCGIYLATQENDTEKLLQYAIVLNQSFGETLCDGCRSGRQSAHCTKTCPFIECTSGKGVAFCGGCPEFPCNVFTDFQSKMPHRVEILESQILLKEIGLEQWLIEMKKDYTCPKCYVVNSTYNKACRNCRQVPSCTFVERHLHHIKTHLEAD